MQINRNDEKILKLIGKDEMNLIEFPITLPHKRHFSTDKTIKFSDYVKGEDNELKERKWIVTGSDEFGLPLVQDNDVLVALLYIGKKNDYSEHFIHFSRYELCKIMSLEPGGYGYKQIERSLDRLLGVSIKAENAFWDNESKCYLTVGFGIVDHYILSKPLKKKDDNRNRDSFVKLNDIIFCSIKSGYIKNIDVNFYFELKNTTARMLYRYLDKKAYGKKKFEINLFNLAKNHIGLSKCDYPSQIKEKLDPAHGELIEKGFLKSADYRPTADGNSIKVVYRFADKNEQIEMQKKALQLTDGKPPASGPKEGKGNETFENLVKIGITETVARGIIRQYPEGKIKAQIEALPFRNAKDPAALLIRSIQEDWAPSAEHKNHIESKKLAATLKAEKEEEERLEAKRRKKIEDYLGNLSEKEKKILEEEALDRAIQDGGDVVRKFGVHEGMFNAYMSMVVEERLKQKKQK